MVGNRKTFRLAFFSDWHRMRRDRASGPLRMSQPPFSWNQLMLVGAPSAPLARPAIKAQLERGRIQKSKCIIRIHAG
ncbi:hypothetical protein GGTG_06998 [Gaeumannomyces tritici R3-111a-1]|uniref:Uncharacterized protein n=1 Tax=Gaeumannomyces tritici (strain R3-111a-1) TaxID=644352 RepID=J3P0F1_GAET3|nr:hypothetical protein GGTG_06998 [Gaeumannomyces tritici R3-111a-1]EJT77084.1 hypothetical protein GGTG_06998 [Gaeumannomyces tritici R3-111a-1]